MVQYSTHSSLPQSPNVKVLNSFFFFFSFIQPEPYAFTSGPVLSLCCSSQSRAGITSTCIFSLNLSLPHFVLSLSSSVHWIGPVTFKNRITLYINYISRIDNLAFQFVFRRLVKGFFSTILNRS